MSSPLPLQENHDAIERFIRNYLEFEDPPNKQLPISWPSYLKKQLSKQFDSELSTITTTTNATSSATQQSPPQKDTLEKWTAEFLVIQVMSNEWMTSTDKELPLDRLFSDLLCKYEVQRNYVAVIETKLFLLHCYLNKLNFEKSYPLLQEIKQLFQMHCYPQLSIRSLVTGGNNNNNDGDEGNSALYQLYYHIEALTVHLCNQLHQWEKAFDSCQLILNSIFMKLKKKSLHAFTYFQRMRVKLLIMMPCHDNGICCNEFKRHREIETCIKEINGLIQRDSSVSLTTGQPHEWFLKISASDYAMKNVIQEMSRFVESIQAYLSVKELLNTKNAEFSTSKSFGPYYDITVLPTKDTADEEGEFDGTMSTDEENKELAGLWYFSLAKLWTQILGNPIRGLYCARKALDTSIATLSKEDKDVVTNLLHRATGEAKNYMRERHYVDVHLIIGRWFSPDLHMDVELFAKESFLTRFTHYLLKMDSRIRNGNLNTHTDFRKDDFSVVSTHSRSYLDLYQENLAVAVETYQILSSSVRDNANRYLYHILQEALTVLRMDKDGKQHTVPPVFSHALLFVAIYHDLIMLTTCQTTKEKYWTELVELLEHFASLKQVKKIFDPVSMARVHLMQRFVQEDPNAVSDLIVLLEEHHSALAKTINENFDAFLAVVNAPFRKEEDEDDMDFGSGVGNMTKEMLKNVTRPEKEKFAAYVAQQMEFAVKASQPQPSGKDELFKGIPLRALDRYCNFFYNHVVPPTPELRKRWHGLYEQWFTSKTVNELYTKIDKYHDSTIENTWRRNEKSQPLVEKMKVAIEGWVLHVDSLRQRLNTEVYDGLIPFIKKFVESHSNEKSLLTAEKLSWEFAFVWKPKLVMLFGLLQDISKRMNAMKSTGIVNPTTNNPSASALRCPVPLITLGLECCLMTMNIFHWLFPNYYRYSLLSSELQVWLVQLKGLLTSTMKLVVLTVFPIYRAGRTDNTYFFSKPLFQEHGKFLTYLAVSYFENYSFGQQSCSFGGNNDLLESSALHQQLMKASKAVYDFINPAKSWCWNHLHSFAEVGPSLESDPANNNTATTTNTAADNPIKCRKDHVMKSYHKSIPSTYRQDSSSHVVCDICTTDALERQDLPFWHCSSCSFDICGACMTSVQSNNPPFCKRNHSMVRLEHTTPRYYSSPRCDLCSKRQLNQGQYWHCYLCGYDMCNDCKRTAAVPSVVSSAVSSVVTKVDYWTPTYALCFKAFTLPQTTSDNLKMLYSTLAFHIAFHLENVDGKVMEVQRGYCCIDPSFPPANSFNTSAMPIGTFDLIELLQSITLSSSRFSVESLTISGDYDGELFGNNFLYGFLPWKSCLSTSVTTTLNAPLRSLTFTHTPWFDSNQKQFFEVLTACTSLEKLTIGRREKSPYMNPSFLIDLGNALEILTNGTHSLQELNIDFAINPAIKADDFVSPILLLIKERSSSGTNSSQYAGWRSNRSLLKQMLQQSPTTVQPMFKSLKSFKFPMDYVGQLSSQVKVDEEMDLLLQIWPLVPCFSDNQIFNHIFAVKRIEPIMKTLSSSTFGSLQDLIFSRDIFANVSNGTMLQLVPLMVKVCQLHFASLRSITFQNSGISSIVFHSLLESFVENEIILPELRSLTLIGITFTDEIASTLSELMQMDSFPQLSSLTIQSAKLNDEQCESLMSSLLAVDGMPIDTLDLSNNALSSSSIPMIIAWLMNPKTVNFLQTINLSGNRELAENDEVMILQVFARCYLHRLPSGPSILNSKSSPLGSFLTYLHQHYHQTRERLELELEASGNNCKMNVEDILTLRPQISQTTGASAADAMTESSIKNIEGGGNEQGFTTFIGYLLQWWKVLEKYLHPNELSIIPNLDASFLSYGSNQEILSFLRFVMKHFIKYHKSEVWNVNVNSVSFLRFASTGFGSTSKDNQYFDIIKQQLRHGNRLQRDMFQFYLEYLNYLSEPVLINELVDVIVEESKNVLTRVLAITTNSKESNNTTSVSWGNTGSISYTFTSYIDGMEAFKTLAHSFADNKSKLTALLGKVRDKWRSLRTGGSIANVNESEVHKMIKQLSITRLENVLIWLCKSYFPCMLEVGMHVNDYGNIFEQTIKDLVDDWHQRESTFQLQYGRSDAVQGQGARAGARQEVFDLPDSEALQAYVILRYRVRQGGVANANANATTLQSQHRDLFSFLLSIPSVRRAVPQNFQQHGLSGGDNALLRIAIEVGNRMAIEMLLAIDSVFELARRNNFYEQTARHGIDMRALANDRESSMVNLTVGEEKRLKRLQDHYMPKINSLGGVNQVFNLIVNRLREEYEKNPVKCTFDGEHVDEDEEELRRETVSDEMEVDDPENTTVKIVEDSEANDTEMKNDDQTAPAADTGVIVEYPLTWSELLEILGLYELISQDHISDGGKRLIAMVEDGQKDANCDVDKLVKIFESYHKHTIHSAWRYLQRPNPWMSSHAGYVEGSGPLGRYSTFEQYKLLIVLLYMGATDPLIIGPHGYTPEQRFRHFVKELAFINRAHNWDHTRTKTLTYKDSSGKSHSEVIPGVSEEYDLLREGDRPSCSSGVKRRLFQALIDHPMFTVLTMDVLYYELKEFFQNLFVEKFVERRGAATAASSSQTQSVGLTMLQRYRDAYDAWVGELDENAVPILRELDITECNDDSHVSTLRSMFDASMDMKFGESYATDLLLCTKVSMKFDLLRPVKTNSTAISEASQMKRPPQLLQLSGLIDANLIFKRMKELCDKEKA